MVFLTVAVALAVAGVMAWRHFMKSPPYVDPVRFPIVGIDVSAHNGIIDYKRVAGEGIRFVFIKASEGSTFRDSLFVRNYKRARAAGLKVGAYHFFRFDRDGIEQARNLISALEGRHPELGVAIDVESHANATGVDSVIIADRLRSMSDFLNLCGYEVTVYSNRDGYYDYLRQTLPGKPLWICTFSGTPINTEWTFWQFHHSGRVAGIDGDVDMNVFCGSEREWQNFLAGAPWPYDTDPTRIPPTQQ